MKKLIITLMAAFAIIEGRAAIPGFGLNYGKGNLYSYGEYNCSTYDRKDQFFLAYFEYGPCDDVSLVAQSLNYPDGSYHDLGLGGFYQLTRYDWMNSRIGAIYSFGPGNAEQQDSILYSLIANGQIAYGFGYILQTYCNHSIGEGKPVWGQSPYLTYDLFKDLTIYGSMTYELCRFDSTIDFSVGFWYCLLRDKFGIQWADLYFDVGNLARTENDVRISVGIDFLF